MAAPLERSGIARDRNAMVRWTRRVVAHRRAILAAWFVLLILGGYAASDLGRLLTNRFSVPGSDAEKGRGGPDRSRGAAPRAPFC